MDFIDLWNEFNVPFFFLLSDKSFILHKSQTLKELNRFYVEKLFPESSDVNLVQYLHPAAFTTDKNRRDFLCKTFVRATQKEKELLADCEELQPLFIDMMETITKAVSSHEKLLVGFQGTFTGFLKIFKEKLIEKLPFECVSRFVDLVLIIAKAVYEEQAFVINGLIEKILEMDTSEEVRHHLRGKIEKLSESAGKWNLMELIEVNK